MKETVRTAKPLSLELILALAAAVGVTAGVIFSLGMPKETLAALSGVDEKLALSASGAWHSVFLRSFAGPGMLLSAAFLLGFSALGQPFEILLAAFRGLGLGLCVRGVYLSGSLPEALLAFLPYALLSTGILILGCRESFRLSVMYLKMSLSSENRLGMKNEIRSYAVRFLIYMLLLAISALSDAALTGALCRM